MDTRAIEYFFELCRSKSFSAAATALFISRQTVSQEIKELERKLGVTLFFRGKKGVELTPAGELYHAMLERMRADYHTTLDKMHGLEKGFDDLIRFGCNLSHLDSLTSQIIANYQIEHPNVKIYVAHVPSTAHCWEKLASGELDLALTSNLPSTVALPYYSNGNGDAHLCISKLDPLSQRPYVAMPDDTNGLTLGVCSEFERLMVKNVLNHEGQIIYAPTMSNMKHLVEEGRCALIAADRQSVDYESNDCARVPIRNISLSTCFVMGHDPTPCIEDLAKCLSCGGTRRDYRHDPVAFRDAEGWPLVR